MLEGLQGGLSLSVSLSLSLSLAFSLVCSSWQSHNVMFGKSYFVHGVQSPSKVAQFCRLHALEG